ncbi:MAG: toprim domain-containing protein [Beijerinckiaceae bacterium]|nr:toprim domain-containing protein [Beijerinckiaceae bacterium]
MSGMDHYMELLRDWQERDGKGRQPFHSELVTRARMEQRADAVAKALSGRAIDHRTVVAPEPGAPKNSEHTLFIRVNSDESLFVYSSINAPRARKRLQKLGLSKEKSPEQVAQDKAHALRIWETSRSISGTPAEAYFRSRRLNVPEQAHAVLRYHPACPWDEVRGTTAPCMIALWQNTLTGEPVAIHRTSLIKSWDGKTQRRAFGPTADASFRLWPIVGPLLVVGEGIETVLSGALHFEGPGPLYPAWAAGNTNNLRAFPVIDRVEELVILVDNDANGAGQNAADQCTLRWRMAGRRVTHLIPAEIGNDFNDLVIKGRCNA